MLCEEQKGVQVVNNKTKYKNKLGDLYGKKENRNAGSYRKNI